MAYTAIDDPEAYFRIKLYTGNGTDDTGIVFDTTDTTMQPDFIWIKGRDSTNEHLIIDSVRGATKYLHTNEGTPGTQGQTTAANSLQSFDSNGFTLGDNANFNTNTNTYVSWSWKESATAGFDIVSFTGSGSAKTENHSLSAVPHVMIVKRYDDAGNYWVIYHHKNTAAPETDYLRLGDNGTNATADAADRWNDTAPTSSVFTINDSSQVNGDGNTYITYLWSEKQGFSKFGVYTGNNNANGNFVYTGFRPAFVLSKDSASGQHSHLIDSKRDPFNDQDNAHLVPSENWSEATVKTNRGQMKTDLLSNGFKINTDGSHTNGTGTHIYMAFAEAPFVNSKGVPCNAR